MPEHLKEEWEKKNLSPVKPQCLDLMDKIKRLDDPIKFGGFEGNHQ